MTSRVVPAVDVTIERRLPVKRLNSVDLPTFGRPTNTTCLRFPRATAFYITVVKGFARPRLSETAQCCR
jgi:hypothetical protein